MENSPDKHATVFNASKTFKKRPGTTDVGKDYENALMAKIVLHQIFDNSKNFLVWSNDNDFGAFDDVILRSDTKCSIQLKHASAKNRTLTLDAFKADKGNFSLKKYFESFKNYENSLSDYDLIIFTNQKFAPGKDEKLVLSDDEEFEIQIVAVDVNPVINTEEKNLKCFQFKIIQKNLSSKLKDYEKFFKKFFIYANQLNVGKLEKNIYKEMEEKFSCKSDVSKNYLDFFTNWNLVNGLKTKLDETMMKRLLALYLVSANLCPISFGPVSENRKILQSAMSKFDVTIFDLEHSRNIWVECKNNLNVREANNTNKNYQITKQYINNLNEEEWTKLLWLMDKCPLIVEETSTVCQAINLCSDRRFVVLTNNNSLDLNKQSVFSKLPDLERRLQPEVFDDLLSNFKCLLSEKEINLKEIESEELQDITTNDLLLMVDEPYKIKEDIEELPEIYIQRHLTRNIIDFKFLDNYDKDTLVFVSNVERVEDLKTKNAVDVSTYLDKFSEQHFFTSEDHISGVTYQGFNIVNLHNLKTDERKFISKRTGENFSRKQNSVKNKMQVVMDINNDLNDKSSEQQVVFTSKSENSKHLFESICKDKLYKSYHHLEMFDGRLEWIKSVGSISSLKEYRLKDGSIKEEELANTNTAYNIHVVVGDPGLGKSCFLKNLKNSCLSKTVAAIFTPQDMKKIADFIHKADDYDKLDDFIMNLKYSNWKKIDRCVLKQLTKQSKVIYMWDALDEIVDDKDRNTILQAVKKFSGKRIVQWMTCRSHLKDALETKFDVLSRTLVEFDKTQQSMYIQERLNSVCPDEVEREKLTSKILNNVSILKHRDILSVPLQIYMLTEICLQDKNKILDLAKGVFSLAHLYEYFVEEKFNFYYKKDKLEKNMFIRNFEKVALKTILEHDIFEKLNFDIDEILEDWQGLGDKFGFVTEVTENNTKSTVKFSHISYAEYFVASYLARRKPEIIKSFIFENKYENVRFFLDLILAKNCPVHLAVLYNNLEQLRCENETRLKDAWGRNPLHLACSWGGKWKRLHCKKNGYKLEFKDYHSGTKETPLEYIQLIEILISKWDVYETDTFMIMNALEYAEKSNSMFALATIEEKCQTRYLYSRDESLKCNILIYSVEFKLKRFFPLLKSYVNRVRLGLEKNTLLHLACKNGNGEMVKVLIDNGSYINASNRLKHTPFMTACLNGCETIVEMLINTGVDVNASKKNGPTAFMLVCFNGHERIVEVLIKTGVDINASSKGGWTPIMIACQNGHKKVVELLMKVGVDINGSNKGGWTPFMVACQNGHENVVELLMKAGVDINVSNKNGWTAFMSACLKGQEKVVKMLINAGVDINASNKNGCTAFMVACQKGHEKVVEMLIETGVDIHVFNKIGWTAFMVACQKGHEKVVGMLIEAGVDINASKKDGVTAFMVASKNGRDKVLEMLVKAGVDAKTSGKPSTFRCLKFYKK